MNPIPLSKNEIVEELLSEGCSRTEAQELLTQYLDGMSEEIGYSVHSWGMDSGDLDQIIDARSR